MVGATPVRDRRELAIANELKQFCRHPLKEGAYVLVGQSMGGYGIRVYASQFPHDVVGMVLIDASHEDQDVRAPESIRKWSQEHHKHPELGKAEIFLFSCILAGLA